MSLVYAWQLLGAGPSNPFFDVDWTQKCGRDPSVYLDDSGRHPFLALFTSLYRREVIRELVTFNIGYVTTALLIGLIGSLSISFVITVLSFHACQRKNELCKYVVRLSCPSHSIKWCRLLRHRTSVKWSLYKEFQLYCSFPLIANMLFIWLLLVTSVLSGSCVSESGTDGCRMPLTIQSLLEYPHPVGGSPPTDKL